jgi:hypothetical protein
MKAGPVMNKPRETSALRFLSTCLRGLRFLKRTLLRITHFNFPEALGSLASLYQFSRHIVVEKTVLLVEPNEFHAETLPGYCYYLKQLGFNVVLLARRKNCKSGVFSRMGKSEMPKVYSVGLLAMRYCLKLSQLNKYDFVFATSTVLAEKHGFFGLFVDYLGHTPAGRFGYFVIEHNFPSLKKAIEDGRVDIEQVFLLSPYQTQRYKVPMLNPNYFGRVHNCRASDKTTFITVGTVTSRNRNFSELVEAVRQLAHEGLTNFDVLIVGRCAEPGMLSGFPGQIKFLGFLDFGKLYGALEKADYYLTLLDPDNDGNRRYLAGETTGSRQLILGFNLVPVINEVFARAYLFNETNAVTYGKAGLVNAMRDAIQMTDLEYNNRRRNVISLAESVREESLTNLNERVASISGSIATHLQG